SAPRPAEAEAADDDPRTASVIDRLAGRLCFSPPLPARVRGLSGADRAREPHRRPASRPLPPIRLGEGSAPRAHHPSGAAMRPGSLLEASEVTKYFPVRSGGIIRRDIGRVQAVDGVTFEIVTGETLGLVGE